jgi:hypothetical protein
MLMRNTTLDNISFEQCILDSVSGVQKVESRLSHSFSASLSS